MKVLMHFYLIITLVLIFSACSHSKKEINISGEQLAKIENHMGQKLAHKLDRHLLFKEDMKVRSYLDETIRKLAGHTDFRVRIFAMKTPQKRVSPSFNLPNSRLYLSQQSLKLADFDSEIAAEIAIQLAHLSRKDVYNHLTQIALLKKMAKNAHHATSTGESAGTDSDTRTSTDKGLELSHESNSKELSANIDFLPTADLPNIDTPQTPDLYTKPDPKTTLRNFGIDIEIPGAKDALRFTESEETEAWVGAVDILYKAGFDPRGLLSLLEKYEKLGTRSPYPLKAIPELQEQVRQKISFYVPLRNPVLRSQEFLVIQERIRKL